LIILILKIKKKRLFSDHLFYGNVCATWLYVPSVEVTFTVACAPLLMVMLEPVGGTAVRVAVMPGLRTPLVGFVSVVTSCVPLT
jgi:hypothetical protein